MSEHQARIWSRMVSTIDAFALGRDALGRLISFLESSLDAAEISDKDLVSQFMNYWGTLETAYACNLELQQPIDEKQVRECLDSMKQFLEESVDSVRRL